jgi:hypothetical protein
LQIFLKSAIFLNKKIWINRKMPTTKEMIEQLRTGKLSLPPLTFRLLKGGPQGGGNLRFDAVVEASWGKRRAKFAVECKSLSTPKAFQDGLNRLKTASLPNGWSPLLFVPFLSVRQLEELEREKISGLDLCGNGLVVVPEVFAVLRSGEKNRFVSSAPIKNIYRKNSSMVGRVFLIRSGFETVQGVCAEINLRNMLVKSGDKRPITLPTVSKALKTLEEDLIIARGDTIRLLQPDSLLEKLRENYFPPNIKERVRLKIPDEAGAVVGLLLKESQALGLPLVASGISSVGQYAVMQRADLLSVYCPRLDVLLERVSGSPTDRFPNLEIMVTEDETVYFDARRGGDFWWASPVQVYLELMAGDKRDRETAEQVRSFLLKDFESVR